MEIRRRTTLTVSSILILITILIVSVKKETKNLSFSKEKQIDIPDFPNKPGYPGYESPIRYSELKD